MDKFQICEVSESFNHAGTKATADISDIADTLGFKRVNIRMNTTKDGVIPKIQRQMGYYHDWKACYSEITENSIVLLQHPFHYNQLTREKVLEKIKKEKAAKFICVIHDVEELRGYRFNDYYKGEFDFMLTIADVIIVHNESMKKFFVEKGFSEKKIVVLGIFDYLQKEKKQKVLFEKSINIAGNLDVKKSKYIQYLGELNGVKVHLYGSNFDSSLFDGDTISYHGSFPANEIPNQLVSGFGLVWDGNSIDGCQGPSGNYLRYNNPHKLSLYLSSGMPVIIWAEAAEAKFVKENHVGICVSSLSELKNIFDKLSENDFNQLLDNVESIKKKLIIGYFGNRALTNALSIIQ